MQAGVSGANDNTEWKWVWKYGANAESVAKNGAACSKSATAPKCYGTKVLQHQSGATSMTLFRWHTEAWVAVGRTQKVPEKKWKW